MHYEDDESHLEEREAHRLETDEKGVALAERKDPDELVELKASFTKGQLLDLVAERAIERMFGRYGNESLEHDLRKHVHALVEQAARDILTARVNEHVGQAVEKILVDGFQTTNEYGEPKGQKKTVTAFVLEYLTKQGDTYSNHRGKERWHATADELVNTYLTKELAPHLEKLKKRCVEALDSSVAGKIREAVIQGLGLKA